MIRMFARGLAALALAAAAASASEYPGQRAASPDLSARELVERAHEASGGEAWRRPNTLRLEGYAVMYRQGAEEIYNPYRMWRVFADDKPNAHAADGKVRIEGRIDGEIVFLLAFDGQRTYTLDGPLDDPKANAQWASNFGFGAIRHALDPGWTLRRLPDDLVDGAPAYFVELTDPSGGLTRFGVEHGTFRVLSVGFDTPRGWHERRYSDFYTRPGVSWLQPRRVRLFYDGVKQNEIVWTDFAINEPAAEDLFAPGVR